MEQRGIYFEEFEVGGRYLHRPGRTIEAADDVLFTTLTGNTQPLHLDEAWSSAQPLGGRLVNGLYTLSLLMGLSVSQLSLGTLVANLGFTDVTFPLPVRHGDTIYAESLVTSLRPSSSRPGEGIVSFDHMARNQRGEVVATASRTSLFLRRPA